MWMSINHLINFFTSRTFGSHLFTLSTASNNCKLSHLHFSCKIESRRRVHSAHACVFLLQIDSYLNIRTIKIIVFFDRRRVNEKKAWEIGREKKTIFLIQKLSASSVSKVLSLFLIRCFNRGICLLKRSLKTKYLKRV